MRYHLLVRVVLLLVSAWLCGACDDVFDLEHIDDSDCVDLGHDEDSDGIDDACDPCPFDAHNDDDPDDDGIALACDPDPAKHNDVVFFSGFNLGNRAGLELFEGYFAEDSFDGMVGDASHGLFWNGSPDGVWVIVGVDVLALDAAASAHELGIIFDAARYSSYEINGIVCELVFDSTDNFLRAGLHQYPNPDETYGPWVQSPLPLDQMHGIIRAHYSRAGTVGCSFETPLLQPSIEQTPTTNPAPGTIALWAEDIGVSFRFLMITTK